MRPKPPGLRRPARGSALLIALFVIVVMALLAAAMGRFLSDSSEKNTVEVRGVRALMAAQSGLELALYQLFPKRPLLQPSSSGLCTASFTPALPGSAGLAGCQVTVSCTLTQATYKGVTSNGYRLISRGRCGVTDLNSASPDFAVSRTLVAEAYDVN